MGDSDRLSQKKRAFVLALLDAPTIREAAQRASIGEATAFRYLSDPAVCGELADRQDALLASVTTGMVGDMAAARACLVAAMTDPSIPPGVRVRAARAVLDVGARLLESWLLARRIAAIERRLDDTAGGEHD